MGQKQTKEHIEQENERKVQQLKQFWFEDRMMKLGLDPNDIRRFDAYFRQQAHNQAVHEAYQKVRAFHKDNERDEAIRLEKLRNAPPSYSKAANDVSPTYAECDKPPAYEV